MEKIAHWVSFHPLTSVAIAAFICGVVLLFLVMRRTMQHREKSVDK